MFMSPQAYFERFIMINWFHKGIGGSGGVGV